MNNHTIIVSGFLFELCGGILLALEMIGFLEKLENWDIAFQDKIKLEKEKLETDSFIFALPIIVLFYFAKKISLKTAFSMVFFSILLIMNYIIRKLIYYLGYLSKKLSTKKILGILGVIFLCLGFLFQLYINLITIQ